MVMVVLGGDSVEVGWVRLGFWFNFGFWVIVHCSRLQVLKHGWVSMLFQGFWVVSGQCSWFDSLLVATNCDLSSL